MSNIIITAARTAQVAHAGQTRSDGEAYINHPMRVAGMVSLVDNTNEEMVAAAWLHDVLEDTDVGVDVLARTFGSRIVQLVDDLTNKFTKEQYPNKNRKERKDAEAQRLHSTQCAEVHTIKLADRYDNINKMVESGRGKKWMKKYLKETWQLLVALDLGDHSLRYLVKRRAQNAEAQL
jgi:(p)ppGpp synthase/HD superfamily hydrolase